MLAKSESETYTPDDLIAGNAHLLTGVSITVSQGSVLKRGSVLGKKTSDDEYLLSLSTASDGTEVPDVILAHDVDATNAAVETVAYERGDFIEQALIFGAAHTADSVREVLRGKNITLIKQG